MELLQAQSPLLSQSASILLIVVAAAEFLIGIGLGLVIVRQRTFKATIENTESANAAAVTELKVHRERAERLSEENRKLIAENEHLKTLTSLEPLTQTVHDWVSEGRLRFEAASKRLDEIHTQQSMALSGMLEELRAQRMASESNYKSMVEALKEQSTKFITAEMENSQFKLRIVGMMDTLERRLSDTAVKIGMPKWEDRIEQEHREKRPRQTR